MNDAFQLFLWHYVGIPAFIMVKFGLQVHPPFTLPHEILLSPAQHVSDGRDQSCVLSDKMQFTQRNFVADYLIASFQRGNK